MTKARKKENLPILQKKTVSLLSSNRGKNENGQDEKKDDGDSRADGIGCFIEEKGGPAASEEFYKLFPQELWEDYQLGFWKGLTDAVAQAIQDGKLNHLKSDEQNFILNTLIP